MSEARRETSEIGMDHPRCPYCHAAVRAGADEDKQSCGACMAWHHAECWQEHGGCSACNQRDTESTRLTRSPPAAASKPGKTEPKSPPPAAAARTAPAIAAALILILGLGLGLMILGTPPTAGPAQPEGPVSTAPQAWKEGLLSSSTEEGRTAAFREGAEAGDPGAMNQLGFRLLSGLGCDPDAEQAAVWGLRAAEAGHGEAMFGLGMLYEQGRGVPRDEARAVAWYRKAVAAGDTMAGPRLDALLRRRPDLR